MKLILASNSPRRKEILKEKGIEFEVIPSLFNEKEQKGLGKERAKIFAMEKAREVFSRIDDKKDIVVLGADTIVYYDNEILEKPKDREDATNMLKKLSNNTHLVITGYALIGENVCIQGEVKSEVKFNNLTEQEIVKYIDEMKPFDKAGSYGIQDGYNLVKGYTGSYDNIVGLPIEEILKVLNKIN